MRIGIRNSIQFKLFCLYASVTTVLFVCLWGWAYASSLRAVSRETEAIMRSNQIQMNKELDGIIRQMEVVIDIAAQNPQIVGYLTGSYSGVYEEYKLAQDMIQSATNTLRGMGRTAALSAIGYRPGMHEIVVKDFDGRYGLDNHYGLNDGSVYVAVYRADRYESESWFPIVREGSGVYWLQTDIDREYGMISLCREVYSPRAIPVGLVKMTIPLRDILPYTDHAPADYSHYYFTKEGAQLFVNEAQAAEWNDLSQATDNPAFEIESDSIVMKDEIAFLRGESVNGWTVISVYPMRHFASYSDSVRTQFIGWLVASLIVMAVASFFIARYFTRRLTALHGQMALMGSGEMNVRANHRDRDEIDALAAGFNQMAGQIQALIEDVYEREIREQRLTLTMLQSQIQPHFLYNTLSAIIRLCGRGDVNSIERMTRALVRFYRIALSEGEPLILLSDEMKHVMAYAEIYAIRYRDAFTLSVDSTDEANRRVVPKIILQPFVENSLMHGMSPESKTLNVRITARTDGEWLIIEIVDDGCGARAAELSSEESTGYGIRNVRERLELMNERNSLTCRCLEPKGFHVSMRILR